MPYYIVQNWNNTVKEAVIQETIRYVINSPSLNWAISNVECEVISDNSLFANTNNIDLTDINEITLTKLGKLS